MNPNFLDFEQPIAELEVKIEELQLVGSDNDINIGDEIANLREKSKRLTEKIYAGLSSWDIVKVARHPQRPYTMDYLPRIFSEFDELHGDRHFADDHAIGAPPVGYGVRPANDCWSSGMGPPRAYRWTAAFNIGDIQALLQN